jgi:hypothetical protein
MYAIHINDRHEKRAGFLHGVHDVVITADVSARREFGTLAEAQATLARLRSTPLHWLNSTFIAATVIELD